MQFLLGTAANINPFNFVNANCSQGGFYCKERALIKLIGLLLTTMASRNGIYSALVYTEIEIFLAST